MAWVAALHGVTAALDASLAPSSDTGSHTLQPLSRSWAADGGPEHRGGPRLHGDAWQDKDMALDWLHIPRCGSSFALPFMKYACPMCAHDISSFINSTSQDDQNSLEGHFVGKVQKRFYNDSCCVPQRLLHGYEPTAHHMANMTTDVGHLVTMLRDPVQRIMSHHAHFDADKPLDEFLKKEWMFGCQASMLLGYSDSSRGRGPTSMTCPHHNATLTESLVKRAVDMVEDPKQTPFIGIVEHWERSIALFNAKAYGDETVDPEDLVDLHASSGSSRTEYKPPKGLSDPVDQAVYDAALRRFEKETASHAANARRLR